MLRLVRRTFMRQIVSHSALWTAINLQFYHMINSFHSLNKYKRTHCYPCIDIPKWQSITLLIEQEVRHIV